jgi:hypothetical protein
MSAPLDLALTGAPSKPPSAAPTRVEAISGLTVRCSLEVWLSAARLAIKRLDRCPNSDEANDAMGGLVG